MTMTAALPVEQIGPLPVGLNRTGTGVYTAQAAALPRPGTWELVLRVQMSESLGRRPGRRPGDLTAEDAGLPW